MEKVWLGIVAFAVAWFIAQLSKTIAGFIRGEAQKEVRSVSTFLRYFGRSGGMPSGHTASFTAMAIFLGCLYGFDSGYFVVAACTWTIIVYDATHVRYAVGVQGEALNKLLRENNQKVLPIVRGHTVPEVAVGALIGIVVAAVMALAFV